MYKYYTWTDKDGYHRGQDLLHRTQIATLLQHTAKPTEAYATIQDYDADGKIIGCPIYFDIDSQSLEEAFWNMSALIDDLAMDFEVTPAVWFSGSKGFHIVLPIYIRHPRCHEIMKMIASEYKNEIDPSVYRDRSMWRCDKTWNAKGKCYKTRMNTDELWGSVMGRSGRGQHLENWPAWKVKDLDLSGYLDKLPERTKVPLPAIEGEGMMPCMEKIWQMNNFPDEWNYNQVIHLFTRHFHRAGISESECGAMFAAHDFIGTLKEREYTKVIKSVYRTGKTWIGCETGSDAELLRPHCQLLCPYNKELDLREVFKCGRDLS